MTSKLAFFKKIAHSKVFIEIGVHMRRTFEACILGSNVYNNPKLTEPEKWFETPYMIERPFTLVTNGSQKTIYAGEKLKALEIDKFHEELMKFCDAAQTPEIRKANAQSIFKSLHDLLEDIETLPIFAPRPENKATSEHNASYESFYRVEKINDIEKLKIKYYLAYLFDGFQSKYSGVFSELIDPKQLEDFLKNINILVKMRPFVAHARVTAENYENEFEQFLCLIQLEELIAKLESKLEKLQATKSKNASTRLQKLITDLDDIKSNLRPEVSREETLGKVTNLISDAAKAPELIKSHTFLMRAFLGFLRWFGWKPEKDIILDELHKDFDSGTNPFRPGR